VLQYELYATRLEELKRNAKCLLSSNNKDVGVLLKLASTMQRLGVAYHFEKEIEEALALLYPHLTTNLYTTALQFRVLREHGFSISSGDGKVSQNQPICFSFCFYEALSE
jgi:hypothetical protein